ncbi:MAG: sugar ABC transporter substrate-binding protein [Bacillota bacterium]|nr:sugar ABC transporter substrate-binding protein [Bacillota bacterium]
MPQTRLRIAVREFSDFENALAEEIALYRAQHAEVEFDPVPLDLHKLYAELFEKEGLRNGTWDIGYITTDWLAEAAGQGALEDLTPYMQQKPVPDWPQGWARSIVEPLYFGDSLYSIPWHDGPECLIYRRDLFEAPKEQQAFRNQYGYDLNPPTTWKQFSDMARFFTRPAEGLYGTLFAAFPDGHNTLYDFALQLWSRGGEFEDENGNALLNTPEAVAALDFYRNTIRDASMCYPEAERYDSTRSGDVFLSGKVAMMVNWFGFAARCDRPGSALNGRVGIAPIPAAEGRPAASLSVFWTMGIGTGSKHKQAAYDFLHFLTQPELDLGIVKHGTVGVRLSTWRNPELQKRAPAYRRIEEVSLGARRLPRSRNLPAFAEVLNDVATEALSSQVPSAEILKKAQQRIQEKGINFR